MTSTCNRCSANLEEDSIKKIYISYKVPVFSEHKYLCKSCYDTFRCICLDFFDGIKVDEHGTTTK